MEEGLELAYSVSSGPRQPQLLSATVARDVFDGPPVIEVLGPVLAAPGALESELRAVMS
jgi:hypothetical protein